MQQEADWRGWWHVSMREMQSELPEFQLPSYDAGSCKKTHLALKWFFFKVTDAVGQQYCTFFGETAEQILGKPADELGEMFNSDGNEFDDFINTKSCLVCLF